MVTRREWTRQQLLVAFAMYCQLPFGKFHHRNPEIVEVAKLIGRTPSALAMKLSNIASLDPAITSTGRKGLTSASANDRAMWEEMQSDWAKFAIESQRAMEAVRLSDISDGESAICDDDVQIGKDRTVETTVRI